MTDYEKQALANKIFNELHKTETLSQSIIRVINYLLMIFIGIPIIAIGLGILLISLKHYF